jgi:hypothetical protein
MDMELTHELEETAREIERRVRPQINDAKKQLSKLNSRVINTIKTHPGKCLLGTLAVGYVIGRIARR